MSSSAPVFIQQGTDVINSVLEDLARGFGQSDDILARFGAEGIDSELLRKVKLSLCTDEDEDRIHRVAQRAGLDVPSSSSSSSSRMPETTVFELCAEAIDRQEWNKQIAQNIFSVSESSCAHLVSAFQSLSLSKQMQEIDALNSASGERNTDRGCDSGDAEPSLDTIELHAVLMQYARIQKKLRKLRQVEESHIQLVHDNLQLTKELVSFAIQPRLIANLLDGVQLIDPFAPQCVTRTVTAVSPPLSTSTAQRLQEELHAWQANTSSIGVFQENQLSFWKWIGQCKREIDLRSNRSPEDSDDLLIHSLLSTVAEIQPTLSTVESFLLSILLSNTIRAEQYQAVIRHDNALFEDKFKAHLSIGSPTVCETSTVPLARLLAQLLHLPTGYRPQEKAIDRELEELRSKHRVLLMKLLDDCVSRSPFEAVLR